MIYARVIGTAVASAKHEAYNARKVLVVQPVTPTGQKDGPTFLAVDAVQAGVGDSVLIAREGNAARQVLDAKDAPVHSVVVAIVDNVELEEKLKYFLALGLHL